MAKVSQPEFKKVLTPVFRAAFVNVATPRAQKNDDGSDGKEKYGLSAIWEPAKFTEGDKKRWAAMVGILDEASRAAFNKPFKDLDPASFKKALRKGDDKELPGYGPGTIFCSLTTERKPEIVDKEGNPVQAGAIYPGCYMRASVNAYGYNTKGKGVALSLNNLQFVADGERLDSRASAAEDFSGDDDMGWLKESAAGRPAGDDLDL